MTSDPDTPQPRPLDAAADDPSVPRVVTVRECGGGGGLYERVVTFPDGSVQAEFFFREGYGAKARAAAAGEDGAAIGADAAARRLAEDSGRRLVYCPKAESWFAWDGVAWRRDRGGGVLRTIRVALREAGVDDPGPAIVAGVERFARTEPGLQAGAAAPGTGCDAEAWDADLWRLGTPGGTVDLTTGTLHPADPAHRITRTTAVAPAETADCPLWRRFLAETTGGDAALQNFLQRFLGYALTGETSEHALLYGIGEGGNGKSVFVNTVRGLFGDYAAVAAPDLFAQGAERRAGKAHSTEIAMLAGARLVTASETEEGRVWADGRLKLLTGGDPVTARFLGRDHFTFTPRFKLIVVGNHMPVLRTVDAALRRRLCVMPFVTQPTVPDRTLEARLRAEWPQILRWMIEGCLAWRAERAAGGLARPASVTAATDAYLGGQDIVGQFLGEWCEMGDTFLETAAQLFAAWCLYARNMGEASGTQRCFAACLDRHGLARERLRYARIYRGVRLRFRGEIEAEVERARREVV